MDGVVVSHIRVFEGDFHAVNPLMVCFSIAVTTLYDMLYVMLCMLGNVSCPPASNMAIENPKSRFACIIEAFPTNFCAWWFKLWLIYVVKVI